MAKRAAGPPDLNTIGGRLRWARENARYTSSRGAALDLNWNENTYKSHEQGERQSKGLKTATAEKYAKAFGVHLTWLLTGKGPALLRDPDEAAWQAMTPEQRKRALRLSNAAE